jgi:diguanylate cyclase (GGDEF)-like protein
MAELFCGDIDASEYGAVRAHIQSITGVAPQALDDVMAKINRQVSEAAELFSIKLAEEISFEEIRRNAMMQMATLSLSAERERACAENKAREVSALNESLRIRAEVDKLTGIANRQTFDDHLSAAIDAALARNADLGLILLDVDRFKDFNDTHGHLAGDDVLKSVGQCLRKISDETQFAARYGGEEFAIVIADMTARDLRTLAEDIRKNIARLRVRHGGADLNVTASLGVAHVNFGEEQIDATEFIRRADGCLYDAKRDGRNRVEITF